MITTTLVTGTLMFEDSANLPESAKIIVQLIDAEGRAVFEKQVAFDSKLLSVFKYLPFELRNFELPADRKCRVSAFVDAKGTGRVEGATYISREAFPVVTGLEDVVLNLAKTDA